MPIDKKSIKAVVFDYGNTLIEFSPTQVMYCDMALSNALHRLFGKHDMETFKAIRARNRLAPYSLHPPEFKENNMVEITTDLVRDLYGVEPSPEQLAELLRVRFDIFVRIVRAPDYVIPLLEKLGRKYRLGVLSNYPDGAAIRQSLAANKLDRYFQAVVVSADLGLVKPHPVPFITILKQLRVGASEAVLIGDNWMGDIQGAHRAGLKAVFTSQWQSVENPPRQPGDTEPDATISHLTQLEEFLL